MFTDKDSNYIVLELSTTRYLGDRLTGHAVIEAFCRHNGFMPEAWDIEERARLRQRFDCSSTNTLLEEWTRREEWKTLFFLRKRPFPIQMSLDIQYSSYAKFNDFYAVSDELQIETKAGEVDLLNFAIDIAQIVGTDYGYLAHVKQQKRQSHVLTPAERLPGIYWANFFGRPYIEFFGRDKLLGTPCYE